LSIPRHIEKVAGPLSLANEEDDEFMGAKKMEVLKGLLEGRMRQW